MGKPGENRGMAKRRSVWAEQELGNAELGDARRTKRAVEIAGARGRQPRGSIGESLGEWAEVKGAYRFFENKAVDPRAIIASHGKQVAARVQAGGEKWVLAIQDSMHAESGEHDVWVHSTLVTTPERVPYGLIQQQVWERDEQTKGKAKDRRKLSIEDKESVKWLRSIRASGALQKELRESGVSLTRVVSVGDRENDLFEAFVQAQESEVDVLIRSAQDRRIAEDDTKKLWDYVAEQPVLGQTEAEVGRNGDRAARIAQLSVRSVQVTLSPPVHHLKKKELSPITVWAVHVIEDHPPKGESPIEWLLLTSVPTTTFQEACERVRWYAVRWLIEMFHKILKSGCGIEDRQFGSVDNFKRYLAIDSIVAWRVLFLTFLGRRAPDMPCSAILETEEWQALYAHTHKSAPLPKQPPTLSQAMLWIAKLGGFLARKSDGHPGTLVIWRGLQHLRDIAIGFALAKNLGKG